MKTSSQRSEQFFTCTDLIEDPERIIFMISHHTLRSYTLIVMQEEQAAAEPSQNNNLLLLNLRKPVVYSDCKITD